MTKNYCVTMLWVGLLIICGSCREKVPPSEYARLMNFERPTTLDPHLVESFELSINGTDALTGTPIIVDKEKFHVTGELKLKKGQLPDLYTMTLRMAHRVKTAGREIDWATPAKEYSEYIVGGSIKVREGGKKFDSMKSQRIKPGLNELRFYLVVEKFTPNGSEFWKTLFIGTGQAKVVPAGVENAE